MTMRTPPLTLKERCISYKRRFPKFPEPFVGIDKRIQGIWILGNDYRNKTEYYGAYPPNYLKRIYSLFPDIINDHTKRLLHLFSGSLGKTDTDIDTDKSKCSEIRFDRRKLIELTKSNTQIIPDVCGNAEKLSQYFNYQFDLILADPPYSEEDAKKYGTCLISRNKVVKESYKVLKPNGYLVWLDQVLPMYRKIEFKIVGVIGLVRSTNHRFRVVTIFQKIN